MEQLAAALGRERIQLQYLLFKLLELQHLLRSGDQRFLRWATAEVARAAQRLRATERERERLAHDTAERLGIPRAHVSLATLAAHLDEPWRTIVSEHVAEARTLAREVRATADITHTLAERSGHAIAETLVEALRPAATGLPLPRGHSASGAEGMPLRP